MYIQNNFYYDYDYFLRKKLKIIKEVTNNLFLFLAAGFDTTFSAMNNCFHTLTAHPDEMKKLQYEIDSVLNDVQFNEIFLYYDF